jgi:hypothetical protein
VYILLPLPRLVRKAEAPETPEALVAKSAQNNALGQVLYSVCSWFAAGLTLLVCYARMIADRSPSCHELFVTHLEWSPSELCWRGCCHTSECPVRRQLVRRDSLVRWFTAICCRVRSVKVVAVRVDTAISQW